MAVGAFGGGGALATVIFAGVLGGLNTVPAAWPAVLMSTFPAVGAASPFVQRSQKLRSVVRTCTGCHSTQEW